MIGLDTNVLVRYVTQDDPDQSPRANALFESLSEREPAFVPTLVLVELHWVLRRAYHLGPQEADRVVATLAQTRELVVEDPDVVRLALRRAADGADLPDAVIAETAMRAGCSDVLTFDARAVRCAGMTLVGQAPGGAA